MTKRYLCPRHLEATPSAIVYGNGFHCFGCGAHGPVTELGLPAGERIEVTYVEDLSVSIARIKSLPRRVHRGFSLHSNDVGYYLLWPNDTYYKFRLLNVDAPGGKYRGPSGHKKPWFEVSLNNPDKVVLVEGEFNALSLNKVCKDISVVSPGGAGDFYSKSGEKELTKYASFSIVHLVVDEDKAGAQAAIEAASRLKVRGCNNVKIHLVKKDFNEILVYGGEDELRKEAKLLGLC